MDDGQQNRRGAGAAGQRRENAGGLGRLGRAALAAAAAGHYVFPLQPRSKLPAVKDWERVATRDPAQIAAWFSARPYNPAIACGPSGLVVVDLDDAHGEPAPEPWAGARHGRDVLAQLATRTGLPAEVALPRTYTVATPTGGMHRYYRAPAGLELRNSAGALGWRIDTRAHGGYIVAAGAARAEGLYRVVERAPIAPLPAWLAEALTPPPPSAAPAIPVAVGRTGGGRAQAYVAAIIERETAQVAAATVSNRHRTLLAAARTLGRLVGGGELDDVEARAALTAAAVGYVGHAGYTAGQVDRDITDGLAYGARMPRRVHLAEPHAPRGQR